MSIKKISINIFVCLFAICAINAQQHLDPEYIKVTEGRAAKIVAKLDLSDAETKSVVTQAIAKQYQNLSKIHDGRDTKIKAVKGNNKFDKKKITKKTDKLKSKANKSLNRLHKKYIKVLSKNLSSDNVDAVKDGMTYGVVPKTFYAFKDMLPNLTEEQKKFIYDNLVEAREHAMDAGSSKEKHGWFGKFKGRINNYLSAQGYDLNKESTDWHKRIEARKKEKSNK